MDLHWFKFNPAKWAMGRIKKCSPQAKSDFIDLCCIYWTKKGQMDIQSAKAECDSYDELLSRNIIKEHEGLISIDFLDEQIEELSDKSAYFRELGKKSAQARAERTSNARPTHVENTLNGRSTDKIRIDKIREIDRIERIDNEPNFSAKNSDIVFTVDTQTLISQTTEKGKEKKLRPKKEKENLSDESLDFAEWWLRTYNPSHIQVTEKMKTDWRKTWDELRREHNKEVIIGLIEWIKKDNWWSSRVLTPQKLTKKNPEGVRYFDLFIVQFRAINKARIEIEEFDATNYKPNMI